MRRAVIAIATLATLLVLGPDDASARSGRVVIGGGVFWPARPLWGYPRPWYPYPYPYYPYPYVYPYPSYWIPPPPPAEPGWRPAPETRAERPATPPRRDAARRASYGLVQLRGVPDGAAVDLDGRFWLEAERLDERWLALPAGAHTLVVRREGARAVERRIEVEAGENHVVRFASDRPS